MDRIIEQINVLYPLSEEAAQALRACLVPCRFPKRHLLIRERVFNKYAYFLAKGITRSFWSVSGEDITTSFSSGGIVFSMDELYYGKPSEEFVEALEEVEVYRIALADLDRLFRTHIELANWGRIIHQNEYRRLHRSHKDRLTLPARERYEAFRQQFPDLCRQVNLKYIASYLGITPATLSRLRGRKEPAQ